jgi:hypothetical protein
VGIKLVGDENPSGGWIGIYGLLDVPDKALFSVGVLDRI